MKDENVIGWAILIGSAIGAGIMAAILAVEDRQRPQKPMSRLQVTSPFGAVRENGRRHMGVDVAAPNGTPILAPHAGRLHVWNGPRIGKAATLRWANNADEIDLTFGHLSAYHASEGDWLEAGELIGWSGDTGNATGPSVHIQARVNGDLHDPTQVFPHWGWV